MCVHEARRPEEVTYVDTQMHKLPPAGNVREDIIPGPLSSRYPLKVTCSFRTEAQESIKVLMVTSMKEMLPP